MVCNRSWNRNRKDLLESESYSNSNDSNRNGDIILSFPDVLFTLLYIICLDLICMHCNELQYICFALN